MWGSVYIFILGLTQKQLERCTYKVFTNSIITDMDNVKVHMLVVWLLLNAINTGTCKNVFICFKVDINVIDTDTDKHVFIWYKLDLNVIDTDKNVFIWYKVDLNIIDTDTDKNVLLRYIHTRHKKSKK